MYSDCIRENRKYVERNECDDEREKIVKVAGTNYYAEVGNTRWEGFDPTLSKLGRATQPVPSRYPPCRGVIGPGCSR